MCTVQPALSYTAPELVKGAQQSNGGVFSAADIFSLGKCHGSWPAPGSAAVHAEECDPSPNCLLTESVEQYSGLAFGIAVRTVAKVGCKHVEAQARWHMLLLAVCMMFHLLALCMMWHSNS